VSRPAPSDDFASAALVGLVRRAMADAGLAAEAPAPAAEALVPLATKRDLLAGLAARHGLRPLLGAGRHLGSLPPDPSVAALLAATGPADLFARWGRLERFVHSRHRVAVRDAGDRHLVAEHVSTAGEPPRPYEDALILGVMAAALAAIGAAGVTVRLGAGPDAPLVVDGASIREPGTGHPTALWRFAWQAFERRAGGRPAGGPGDAAATLRRLVASDPARGWTVADAASAMGTSGRSLQRALAAAGGFSAVVGSVRADRAADLLINADHPLSIVGFACGYADQPHFTREFGRRTAMTPAAYRRAFATARGSA